MVLPRGEKPTWRKSSYSGSSGSNCVEVAAYSDVVGVRDSKDRGRRDRLILEVQRGTWAGFIAGCRAGEFDI